MPRPKSDTNALAAGLLTFKDSQILQLLTGGTSERRVVDIGNWRRAWTADDVQRVARDYINPPAKRAGRKSDTRPSRPRLLEPGDSEQWLPPVFDDQPTVYVLTPAQGSVLTALCEGLTTTAAAARLQVAEDTIKSHVKSIFSTFGVRDRLRVVALISTGQAVVQVQSRAGRRSA